MKKTTVRIITGGIVMVLIAGSVWFAAARLAVPKSDIVSRNGLHWHPVLTIYVKGEKLDIPSDIGLGATHKPVHTHEDSTEGIIHLEFEGLVTKEDVMLERFFENWGKRIDSFGANVKMTVNGKENTDYGKYVMRDGDRIELRYE